MSEQRVLLTPCYLLHRRAYGDTSAILELFSREHGRVGVIARGVRGGRGRRRAQLQGFAELRVSWQGRGELHTLTDVELAGRYRPLAGPRLVSGFYLNELLLRLLRRDDPHPQLYDAYGAVVAALQEGADEDVVLRLFEKRLLEELGYGLILDHDIAGAPVLAEGRYRYRLEAGPEPVAGEGPEVYSGAALLALAEERAEPAMLRELRPLMRRALSLYLGERPLKSRELYRQFSRSQSRTDQEE